MRSSLILCLFVVASLALDPCDNRFPHITAAEVHEELESLSAESRAYISDFVHAPTAGFLWSHSYKPISSDTADGIPAQYGLSSTEVKPSDQVYTRTSSRIYYGQTSDASHANGIFETTTTILTVADNQQTDHCLYGATQTCPESSGNLCEVVTPTRINVTILWPIDQVFNLVPLAHNLPFTYVSIDDYSGLPAECSAQSGTFQGTTCANVNSQCNGMYPCDGTSFIDQSVVDSLLTDNCGASSDPWTEWEAELNDGECLTACCNPVGSSHQRWGIGPPTRLYDLAAPSLATAELRVTVEAEGDSTVYEISTSDLSPGLWYVPDGSTNANRKVRLGIARTYALATSALPQLNGGRIIAWGEPGTVPTEPCTVPTASCSNSTGGGWAYLDPSLAHTWSQSPNGYSIKQSGSTNLQEGFGQPNSCNDNFYSSYTNVPGWFVPDGESEPYAPSPCQISNALNELAAAFASDPSPYLAEPNCMESPPRASIYLPPDYLLQMPNYVLDEEKGTLTRHLLFPGCGKTEAAATQIYVDVSEDVMQYESESSTAGIVSEGSGCAYNFIQQFNVSAGANASPSPSPTPTGGSRGYGTVTITVRNSLDASTPFIIQARCSVVGTNARWSAQPVSPNNFQMTVLGRDTATTQAMLFDLIPQGVGAGPSNPFVLQCATSVSSAANGKVIASETFTCHNMTSQVYAKADLSDLTGGDQPCDSFFDFTCPQHDTLAYKLGFAMVWVVIGVAFVVVIVIIVAVIKAVAGK